MKKLFANKRFANRASQNGGFLRNSSHGLQPMPNSLFFSVYCLARGLFDAVSGGSVNFVFAFVKYFYLRFRMVGVLGGVVFEVGKKVASHGKEVLMGWMFWGRSPMYRTVVQVGGVGVIIVAVLVQFYQQPLISVASASVDVNQIQVAENDLIVETGSTQTLIPKSRGRLDTMSYTVQPGDTIGHIAKKFGLKQSTILWSNGLTADDIIKPGDVLQIPEGDGVLHKVKAGDTLDSIAKKYHSNAQAIATANWIDDPSQLRAGMELFVPNGEIIVPKRVVASKKGSKGGVSGNTTLRSWGGGPDPAGVTMIWPVAGGAGTVTQCPSWYHKAIDIADRSYPYIVAARSGTVVFAGIHDPYGYSREIVIDHGGGIYTQYAHLSAWAVSTGQHVKAGQIIGRMGRSGLATGVHLHWEVRVGCSTYKCRVINPQYYLNVRICR